MHGIHTGPQDRSEIRTNLLQLALVFLRASPDLVDTPHGKVPLLSQLLQGDISFLPHLASILGSFSLVSPGHGDLTKIHDGQVIDLLSTLLWLPSLCANLKCFKVGTESLPSILPHTSVSLSASHSIDCELYQRHLFPIYSDFTITNLPS